MKEGVHLEIIHITNLSNNKASGIARIVPMHIISQSKKTSVKWINMNDIYESDFDTVINFNNINGKNELKLAQLFQNVDLAVFHGVYFFQYYLLSKKLSKNGIPYIIVPHGSLTNNSISQKRIKKSIAFGLFLNDFIRGAEAIQFLTEGEKDASKTIRYKKSIIVPNGCSIPLIKKEHANIDSLTGVFIGRKSIYYKGLDILIEACSIVKEELLRNKVLINLYGPDEKNSNIQLMNLIEKYNLEEIINLYDEVYDVQKENAILDGDFFILTSRTEGHPVALVEALSYGLPCLVTKGTNMANEVNNYNAGWGVETEPNSIASALLKIVSNKNNLDNIGTNARKLSKLYSWENISSLTISMYEELMNEHSTGINKR